MLETVGSLLKEASGFVIRLQGNGVEGGAARSRGDPALPGLPLAPDLLVSYVLDAQERKGPAPWLGSLSPSVRSAGMEGGRTGKLPALPPSSDRGTHGGPFPLARATAAECPSASLRSVA